MKCWQYHGLEDDLKSYPWWKMSILDTSTYTLPTYDVWINHSKFYSTLVFLFKRGLILDLSLYPKFKNIDFKVTYIKIILFEKINKKELKNLRLIYKLRNLIFLEFAHHHIIFCNLLAAALRAWFWRNAGHRICRSEIDFKEN